MDTMHESMMAREVANPFRMLSFKIKNKNKNLLNIF
jgi:hypothetical protein